MNNAQPTRTGGRWTAIIPIVVVALLVGAFAKRLIDVESGQDPALVQSVLLNTPVPRELVHFLEIAAPVPPLRRWLEAAMRRSILPPVGEREDLLRQLSRQLLFLRSHWLRMPPMLLLRHLATQARRRGGLKTAEGAAGDV